MNTGQKIKMLRKRAGLTQTDLGDMVGVKKNAVSKWECGRVEDIPTSTIKVLASIFDVKPSYLVDEDKPDDIIEYKPTQRIPIYGAVAAGLPIFAEENIEGYTYTDLNHGGKYFALRVRGDSMTAARIYDGDLLIVRKQEEVENGQIAVVNVDGDSATVKRFYQNGNTITLMPQSTNPIHQPQVYDARETQIMVQGLVVKNEITF